VKWGNRKIAVVSSSELENSRVKMKVREGESKRELCWAGETPSLMTVLYRIVLNSF